MKYCLIGCGRVAPEHIGAARANGLAVAAVCDVLPAAARALCPDTPFYEDYRDMLRKVKPDLVAIATPSGLHAAQALGCLAAGAHVIIEKPMAMAMADAHRIAEAASKAGLTVCVNLQNRFNPAVQALRRAVDAGRFGRIYSAGLRLRWHRGADYYSQAPWRGTNALDGGCMMNQGIHGIDLLDWMLGGGAEEITALRGTLARDIETEDLGMALLRYPGGTLASIECTTLRYPAGEESVLEINGAHGLARLGGVAGHVLEAWAFDDAAPGEEAEMRRRYSADPACVYGRGHSLLYADVLAAIAQGRAPLVDAKEGMRALEIVLRAYGGATV